VHQLGNEKKIDSIKILHGLYAKKIAVLVISSSSFICVGFESVWITYLKRIPARSAKMAPHVWQSTSHCPWTQLISFLMNKYRSHDLEQMKSEITSTRRH
jgi:hypothetical protein